MQWHRRILRRILPAVLVLMAAGGVAVLYGHVPGALAAGEGTFWIEGSGRSAPSAISPDLWVELAKQLKPAVVNISTTQVVKAEGPPVPFPSPFGEDDPFNEFFRRFFGERQREFTRRSLGSGFLVSRDGYIVTNNHVVENAKEITVALSNDHQYKGRVVGRDAKTDLALLKIDPKEQLLVIPLGDSDRLQVGEWVMAIGNPFGLSQTVTVGVVSAKERVIGQGPYDDFIQTDASINPGNSGGPLINTRGEVVGINSAIFSQTGGSVGIGFAIPINMAKAILPQLKEKGAVTRGWLGVSIQGMTEELAKSFGLSQGRGALVADVVPDGPAEQAGLKRGDVIVEFDGHPVPSANELPRLVAETPVGKEVPIKILRDGKEETVRVKVGELKETQEASVRGRSPRTRLGLSVQELTPELAQQLGVPEKQGVVVTGVAPGSPAEAAGIQQGDVILEMDRKKVRNLRDIQAALRTADPEKGTLLLIRRGSATLYVLVKAQG